MVPPKRPAPEKVLQHQRPAVPGPGAEGQEQLALLATDGMLVKRPILLAGEQVLVGFQEAQWAQALL